MFATEILQNSLQTEGIPRFRLKQILHAIYKEGKNSYEEMTTLPLELREKLSTTCPILSIKPIIVQSSKDKATTKALFTTHDNKNIEAVLMRFADGRISVCVSSQVGCQLGCKFCATGTLRFGRNLTYEEIADQVLFFAQQLMPSGEKISNIIYMGMGEPFMNYDNVIQSVQILNDKDRLHIGARHITISTSGICEGIGKLAQERLQVNLAVSLHAPNQELRQRIMPIARKYSLEQLMYAIKDYIKITHRRVSYEYVMLKDINDSEENAKELAALVKDQLCHINLIPYNATGIEGIKGSERERITQFRNVVAATGVPITIRVTLGQDIDAACGQLANKALKTEK